MNVKEYANNDAKLYDNRVVTIEELTVVGRESHLIEETKRGSTSPTVSSKYILSQYRDFVNRKYSISEENSSDKLYSIDDSAEVSGSEAADNQAALERFGTTTDFEQAGFAMADGRMLKLSQYGGRGVQHRVIEGIYEDTKGDEAIARFIRNGNVRISAASPGIEISAEKPLTTNQLNVVSRFASKSLAGRGV